MVGQPAEAHRDPRLIVVGPADVVEARSVGRVQDQLFRLGLGEDVAVDPAGVGEQVRHRDPITEIRGAEPHAGQRLGDGRVQGQQALVDQLHDHRGGPQLGDRPDLEQGAGADPYPGGVIEQPRGGQDLLPSGPDPEYGSGHTRLPGQFG